MKRNMEVSRRIVLALRNAEGPINTVADMPDLEYLVNAQYIIEAGFAEGEVTKSGRTQNIPDHVTLTRLTWSGQDFAESIKDDNLWDKAKEHIPKLYASWTFAFFADYLESLTTGTAFIGN